MKSISRQARTGFLVLIGMTSILPAQTVELKGAGATFPAPLYAKWVDAYNKAHPQVKVDYQAVGSGAGIKAITEKNVQFGGTDAPLSDEQISKLAGKMLHVPTVAGAVVLAYNLPEVKGEIKLSAEVIAGIYLGQIAKWSDPKIAALNSDLKLPDTDIVVVRRSDGSGTTFIFTDYLSKISPEWVKAAGKAGTSVKWPTGMGAKGNDGVAQGIKNSAGGIGYVEQAYAVKNGMTFATLINKEGAAVKPTQDSLNAALENSIKEVPEDLRVSITNAGGKDSYPICGVTYLLVYQDLKYLKNAALAKELINYLTWCVTAGQEMAPKLDYTPLPKALREKVETRLKTIVVE